MTCEKCETTCEKCKPNHHRDIEKKSFIPDGMMSIPVRLAIKIRSDTRLDAETRQELTQWIIDA